MSDINISIQDEIVNIDVLDTPVLVNVVNSPGVPGAPGAPGVGVPVGGTTGQVLAKNSNTNYDTEWIDVTSAVWGNITGTLSNQTDLQNALDAKVPYTGATADVDLGEYGINVGNVIYDTTPTGIPTEQGATYWDSDAETVALIMNGTIQKVGEDTFFHVRNTTGSTIAKGTAVRFAGTTGNSGRLLIAPMIANGSVPSAYYMGVTAEEIANNTNGKVYHFGKMRGVDTSAYADGDLLYVSTTSAGAFQTAVPQAPNNIILAAAVVHGANNGTLMIRSSIGSNINQDEGVLITTPTANDVLAYDSVSGLWKNETIASALGYTPANAATTITINGVTFDLSANRTFTVGSVTGTGTAGQVAFWSGSSAVSGSNNLFWDNVNGRLGIGTNALINDFVIQKSSTTTFLVQSTGTGIDGRAAFSLTRNASGTQFGWQFLKDETDNFTFRKLSGGVTEVMRLTTSNNLLINSVVDNGTDKLQVAGSARVANKLSLGAGTTSAAQINLASSTAPTSPSNGDIWFDGTDIKMRIGGVTKTFTLV